MYKLIAHRGEKKSSKENSMAAFFDAIKGDYVGFECDVRTAKEGNFIIYHNPLLDGKLIKMYNSKELKEKQVVMLQEVLEIETDKIILLDIKDPFIDTESFSKIVEKYDDKKIYVMSFYDNVIRKLYNTRRNYKVGILNYVLNTDMYHFKYDFLCILDAISNDKIINSYKLSGKELFIYGVKRNELNDNYPYYIVD